MGTTNHKSRRSVDLVIIEYTPLCIATSPGATLPGHDIPRWKARGVSRVSAANSTATSRSGVRVDQCFLSIVSVPREIFELAIQHARYGPCEGSLIKISSRLTRHGHFSSKSYPLRFRLALSFSDSDASRVTLFSYTFSVFEPHVRPLSDEIYE